jgi:hypothetical protein
MGWGTLFDKRLEYAVGSFDGQRNGYGRAAKMRLRGGAPSPFWR